MLGVFVCVSLSGHVVTLSGGELKVVGIRFIFLAEYILA